MTSTNGNNTGSNRSKVRTAPKNRRQAVFVPKNILLISPDSGKEMAERQFFSPPLGVMRLAGFLNAKGHVAEFFDPNLYSCNGKGPSLKEKLAETDWDIIGFSVLDQTLMEDLQNIYLAKEVQPKALIIAGGIEAQFNYQTMLDKSPCRIVILGEGEIPLKMLADGDPWEKIPGIVVKNMAMAMSEELFNEATQTIAWESINYEEYWDIYIDLYKDQWNDEIADQIQTVRVFSRNRCPIGCKYCSSTPQLTQATGLKIPVISTTEDNLIEVVDRVVKSHPGVRMIYLTDDDFVINKLSVIRFCKKVIEHDFGDLIFMCFSRITDLTEEVVSWMDKANFRKLNIGLESFSQDVLTEIGKRCDVDRIRPALDLLKKYNIRPFCAIILTTPQSTLEDVEMTIDGISSYLTDDFYQAGIIPAIFPLKGTEFAETYWDYKSETVALPGTDHFIRRDEIIYCEDPLAREFQIRYLAEADAVVEKYTTESDIRHKNAANLALVRLGFAKQLIAEIREKHGIPTDGSPGGQGPTKGRPGDSTRHALV